ncbi:MULTISPECIES: chromate transporter [Paraburkholderia]|uniref:chromate transporter n=1 Tax=Paraburkholderia TaxID=1822464 RepID=UPI001FEAC1B9|nr:chromate transporter [Paraburkholderia podalyriae]
MGYFRDEFVKRRRWLDEHTFGDLVALCQFLPGPGSSQVGIAIGRMRGGIAGALAAWLGFTLPPVALLTGFACGFTHLTDATSLRLLRGLKLAAVRSSRRRCGRWDARSVPTAPARPSPQAPRSRCWCLA